MGAVFGRVESELGNPRFHDSCVLSGGDVRRAVDSAREKEILGLQVGRVDPLLDSPSGIRSELELNRSPRLLLDYGCSFQCSPAVDDVSDLEAHEITASELTVDRKVEQSKLSRVLVELESDADSPDLREFQRWLRADQVAFVP